MASPFFGILFLIFGFISLIGIHDLFWGCVFLIIGIISLIDAIHSPTAKSTAVEPPYDYNRLPKQLLRTILEECQMPNEPCDINWYLWYEKRDEINWSNESVLLEAKEKFESNLDFWITVFNRVLMDFNYSTRENVVKNFKDMSSNTGHALSNLNMMAQFSDESIKNAVSVYIQAIYDYVVYEHEHLTAEKLNSIILLGEKIRTALKRK